MFKTSTFFNSLSPFNRCVTSLCSVTADSPVTQTLIKVSASNHNICINGHLSPHKVDGKIQQNYLARS